MTDYLVDLSIGVYPRAATKEEAIKKALERVKELSKKEIIAYLRVTYAKPVVGVGQF